MNERPMFATGQLTATPRALVALEIAGQQPCDLLMRHMAGDWGVVDAIECRANDDAVAEGTQLLSAYPLDTGEIVCVVTSADRTSTCVMLPDEC
jgi:hypothetical protein